MGAAGLAVSAGDAPAPQTGGFDPDASLLRGTRSCCGASKIFINLQTHDRAGGKQNRAAPLVRSGPLQRGNAISSLLLLRQNTTGNIRENLKAAGVWPAAKKTGPLAWGTNERPLVLIKGANTMSKLVDSPPAGKQSPAASATSAT
jgi:hypothetical protein